jgi:hypothetical protein
MKYIAKQWRLCFWVYLLTLGLLILGNNLAHAQENKDNPEEEAEFVNFGYVSVSPKYTIGPKAKRIIFKIRNNATRSIKNIFAWVYEIKKEEDGGVSGFRLVNNPNKSGLPIKGGAHEPSAEEQWSFPLIAANPPIDPSKQFTLLVDPRGVRFAAIENY